MARPYRQNDGHLALLGMLSTLLVLLMMMMLQISYQLLSISAISPQLGQQVPPNPRDFENFQDPRNDDQLPTPIEETQGPDWSSYLECNRLNLPTQQPQIETDDENHPFPTQEHGE